MGQKDKRPARPTTKEDSWGELRITLTHRQTKTHIQDEEEEQQRKQ